MARTRTDSTGAEGGGRRGLRTAALGLLVVGATAVLRKREERARAARAAQAAQAAGGAPAARGVESATSSVRPPQQREPAEPVPESVPESIAPEPAAVAEPEPQPEPEPEPDDQPGEPEDEADEQPEDEAEPSSVVSQIFATPVEFDSTATSLRAVALRAVPEQRRPQDELAEADEMEVAEHPVEDQDDALVDGASPVPAASESEYDDRVAAPTPPDDDTELFLRDVRDLMAASDANGHLAAVTTPRPSRGEQRRERRRERRWEREERRAARRRAKTEAAGPAEPAGPAGPAEPELAVPEEPEEPQQPPEPQQLPEPPEPQEPEVKAKTRRRGKRQAARQRRLAAEAAQAAETVETAEAAQTTEAAQAAQTDAAEPEPVQAAEAEQPVPAAEALQAAPELAGDDDWLIGAWEVDGGAALPLVEAPTVRRRRRRRPRLRRIVKIVLVVVLIGGAAAVPWVVPGVADLLAQSVPDDAVGARNIDDPKVEPARGFVGPVAVQQASGPYVGVELASAGRPLQVDVPRLHVDSEVIAISSQDRELVPPDDPQVLGWWQQGRAAGARFGSAVVTGHTVHTGGGAFDHLAQLVPGDTIRVRTAAGWIKYVVSRSRIYSVDGLRRHSEDIFAQGGEGRLVLITCDDWDGKVYRSNAVVYAVPVLDQPFQGAPATPSGPVDQVPDAGPAASS